MTDKKKLKIILLLVAVFSVALFDISSQCNAASKPVVSTSDISNIQSSQVTINGNLTSMGTDYNMLDYSTWTEGTGSVTGFTVNGTASENYRILGDDPWGTETIVWEARTDVESNADGGWYGSRYSIDPTKTYRFSVWVNRTVQGNGSFYLGLYGYNAAGSNIGVLNRVTGANSINPYFISTSAPTTVGVWTLYVAHVWPAGSGIGSNHSDSGKYTVSGGRVGNISYDFVWNTLNAQTLHRSYLYYSTDINTRQRWLYPRIDLIDGTEPTIAELLSGEKHTSVYFQWGTDPADLSNATTPQDMTDVGSFNEVITGLETGTIYYYRTVASNEAGTEYGSILSFSIGPTDYGVELNTFSDEFEGWAWGGNDTEVDETGVIGWLSFNDKNTSSPIDYQVVSSIDFPPSVLSTSDAFSSPCSQSRIPTLSWAANESDNFIYQIQIDNGSGFDSPIIDATGTFTGTSGSWNPSCTRCCNVSPYDEISWGGITYYWRVRIEKTDGEWSSWNEELESFETNIHCYPFAYFLCSFDQENWYDCDGDTTDGKCAATPECLGEFQIPPVGMEFYIKDFSTCYASSTDYAYSFDAIECSSSYYENSTSCPDNLQTTYYTWDLTNASTSEASSDFSTSTISFLSDGEWIMDFTVTDTHSPDQSCSQTETETPGLPLPKWKEIAPF
jgi:hypothetical protein